MTDIIVTAIITALATVLIMMMAIATAAVNEDNEKDNKKIEELESKIKLLELNMKLSVDQNNANINIAYKSFKTNINNLIDRVEKLESKKTTKKK